MIISRTPFRVSLLGGGCDYPDWFLKHGGLVVGGSINKSSIIQARYLPPFHEHKTRLVYNTIETVRQHSDIEHRAFRACLKYVGWDQENSPGLEIFHMADLPGMSGMGTSSSFVVGLLNTLCTMQGKYLSPHQLAEAAIYVEQTVMGEIGGCQDQVWAAHGGLNIIKFRKSGEINVFPLAISQQKVEELESHLMLFFTKISRISSHVAQTYAPTIGQREREMWTMVRLAEEGVNIIQNGKYEKLGKLLDDSWRVKSSMSSSVSSPEISKIYNTARVTGAWGGKITGAGGGGCCVLAVPEHKRVAVRTALENLGCFEIPFKFSFDGSSIIFCDRSNDSEYRTS